MFYCFRLKKIIPIAVAVIVLAVLALIFAPAASSAPASAEETIELPIIMYHSVYKDASLQNDYIISADTFRADMEFLKEHGYETIFPAELFAYTQGDASLPEKPVMITFDDGYLDNLFYVLPILQELDMTALISVVGAFSEEYTENGDRDPAYAYLSWDDICQLNASGAIEIGSHTYNMHALSPRRGSSRLWGESDEEYTENFTRDLSKLQDALKEHCGITPTAFAYPYGFISAPSVDALKKMGFTCAFTCEEKVNYLTGDPQELYALHRFNRPAGVSTADFMARLKIT